MWISVCTGLISLCRNRNPRRWGGKGRYTKPNAVLWTFDGTRAFWVPVNTDSAFSTTRHSYSDNIGHLADVSPDSITFAQPVVIEYYPTIANHRTTVPIPQIYQRLFLSFPSPPPPFFFFLSFFLNRSLKKHIVRKTALLEQFSLADSSDLSYARTQFTPSQILMLTTDVL